jgi:hypothetical protein
MLVPPSTRPERPKPWLALTACLLGVLVFSHDLPAKPDRVGPAVLGAKLQWTAAWASLHWLGLLPAPSAGSLVQLDPELRSARAQEAARWLARHASLQQRLRWAAMLTARNPNDLPLLRQTTRDALRTGRCDLLRAAVAAGRTLPAGSTTRRAIADEFAAPDAVTRWGSTASHAARRIASTARPNGATRTPRSSAGRGSGAHRTRSSPCVL